MRLPTVLNMDGPAVVFGGGDVGMRKVEYLSKFSTDVILISQVALPMPDGVKFISSTVTEDNIHEFIPENTCLVVAALSSKELNHAISRWCMAHNILVNVVDDTPVSNILFPAISRQGDVNIAISTSGRCPFLARKIREGMDNDVSEMSRWLELLSPLRNQLVGIDEKNRVLELVYADVQLTKLVEEGNMDKAIKRAKEVFDVHRQS